MDGIALVLAETRVAEACLVDPASDPHPCVTAGCRRFGARITATALPA